MDVLQRCPICEGHGSVPGGFYLRTPGLETWVSGNSAEMCRTCQGRGTVLVTQQDPDEPRPFGVHAVVAFLKGLNKVRKSSHY